MKKLVIAFIALALLAALSCSTAPTAVAASDDGLPLTVEYTLQYRIELPWQGQYYPGSTSIRVEMYEIPINTDHQTVQATLNQGSIETIDGKDTWVIDTKTIYSNNIYTGTFVVTVDLGGTAAVPHQPLTAASGMDQYLLPDEYVTLSADVVSQAQLLLSEVDNDTPKIIAKFVDWIQKNISYDDARWAERLAGAKFPDLTDSQTLSARAGVCTDFSNLFMGFCRAVGIPARSVLGYGLRSSEEDLYQDIHATRSHAWTEVWIPDYGWLTVDPTWGDIGDVRKIATGKSRDLSWRWWYSGAPPGSGVIAGGATYSVTLTGWKVINTVAPITLTQDNASDPLKFSVTNSSPIPLLDNITVKKCLLQNNAWSDWMVVFSEITFLNPGETYSYTPNKESGVGYFLWSKQANDMLVNWQYPGGTTTSTSTTPISTTTPTEPTLPTELMDWLPFVMVAIILAAIVGSAASARRRRKLGAARKPQEQEKASAAAAPGPEPEPAPAKGLVICPKCHKQVPAESNFCTECGADLRPRKRKA